MVLLKRTDLTRCASRFGARLGAAYAVKLSTDPSFIHYNLQLQNIHRLRRTFAITHLTFTGSRLIGSLVVVLKPFSHRRID